MKITFLFRYFFFFFAFLIALTSCKRKNIKTKSISGQLRVAQIEDFEYLSSQGKMSFKTGKQSLKASVTIRMRKDSVIWLSARKFGIEGLRVLATKDSLFILEKQLNKSFRACDFSKISNTLRLQANFETLEAMLLGNPLPVEGEYLPPIKKEKEFIVQQNIEGFTIQNHINRQNHKLSKVIAQENNTENQLIVNYEDFKPVGKHLFPYKTSSTVEMLKDGKKITQDFSFEYTKVNLSQTPLRFPFKVSSKYPQKECK